MATYTSHLNLKLPDYSDVADVKDLNDNFKKIDDAIASGGTGGGTGGITKETDPTVPAWAKQPNKPTYTASEVGALPNTTVIPTVPSALPNPQPIIINGVSYDGREKKEINIQAEGGGIVVESDPTVPDWAKTPQKPKYTADEVGALPDTYKAPVQSVNGKTGAVTLIASDVGALPNTTEIPIVPEKLPNPQPIVINGVSYDGSERKEVNIQAEGGGIVTETDPTVPAWAKAEKKPSYTAEEVGALPSTYEPPVKSVNGKTGEVSLVAADVGALPDTYNPPVKSVNGRTGDVTLVASDVGALPSGGTAVNANALNGKSADKFAQIELEEAEDAGDILLANADLLAGKSLAQIMLMMYPVGAIYTSTVATNPAALFGGTWESIGGRFLLGADSTYPAGSTGGEAAVTLTVDQMPSHNHSLPAFTFVWGNDVDNVVHIRNAVAEAGTVSGNRLYTDQSKWNVADTTGGSQPHNNMPPYLSVYMWKRTA